MRTMDASSRMGDGAISRHRSPTQAAFFYPRIRKERGGRTRPISLRRTRRWLSDNKRRVETESSADLPQVQDRPQPRRLFGWGSASAHSYAKLEHFPPDRNLFPIHRTVQDVIHASRFG